MLKLYPTTNGLYIKAHNIIDAELLAQLFKLKLVR